MNQTITFGPLTKLMYAGLPNDNYFEPLQFTKSLCFNLNNNKLWLHDVIKYLLKLTDKECWFADEKGNEYAGIIAQEYKTESPKGKKSEIHEQYDDVRLILAGSMKILLSHKDSLTWDEFDKKNDIGFSKQNCAEIIEKQNPVLTNSDSSQRSRIRSIRLPSEGLNIDTMASTFIHIPSGMAHAAGMIPSWSANSEKTQELVIKCIGWKELNKKMIYRQLQDFISLLKH